VPLIRAEFIVASVAIPRLSLLARQTYDPYSARQTAAALRIVDVVFVLLLFLVVFIEVGSARRSVRSLAIRGKGLVPLRSRSRDCRSSRGRRMIPTARARRLQLCGLWTRSARRSRGEGGTGTRGSDPADARAGQKPDLALKRDRPSRRSHTIRRRSRRGSRSSAGASSSPGLVNAGGGKLALDQLVKRSARSHFEQPLARFAQTFLTTDGFSAEIAKSVSSGLQVCVVVVSPSCG
jgi:hypothetical protein